MQPRKKRNERQTEMKREDLKALGLEDTAIDSIMALHGKDIESHKATVTTTQAEVETLKGQLTDANKQIENFKDLNIDQIKASADEYKTKFEQARTESATQLASLKFDHALESALTGAKVRNTKAVSALLSTKDLKLTEDGKILGLDEQLTKIKSENDYLFADSQPAPKIITGANSKTVLGDPQLDAMRKGAGLPIQTP